VAAPVVAALVAFLTGAGGGVYGAPWLLEATKVEAGAAIAYVDLRKGCAIAQPLVDVAGRERPKSAGLARWVKLVDAICADAAEPDTPVSQIKLVADIVDALRLKSKTSARTSAATPTAPRHCGRNLC
jgi:hypothetical protein